MTRRLNALAIALLGVLAISGIAAADASAVTHTFHGEVEPIVLTAEQESAFVFSVGEIKLECKKVRLQGTGVQKTEEIEGHTEVEECEIFGMAATVKTEGCTNRLTGETSESGDAPVKLECEAGKFIEVTTSGCTIKVGSQTVAGGGVHYTDLGSGTGREVTVAVTESKIAYTSSGFVCMLSGLPSSGNNAGLVGTFVTKGYEDLKEPGPPTKPPYEIGAQVGIWVE